MQITIPEARALTIDAIKAGLVPMVAGSPGLGKSDYLRSIADEFKLEIIDVRLSQADSVDLNGFPFIDVENNVSSYIPFDTFPTEDTKLPKGKEGWLLLLDEINSAPNLVQAASYKLILDREVGQKRLHDKVITVAAGNLDTDKAIVNKLSTAMQSRLVHLQVKADIKSWVDWALKNDVDYRVVAFLQFKPDLLHKFDPDHNDVTFPCPRTWHFMSRLVKDMKKITNDKLPLLAGTVSEGPAIEFKAFADIFETLPSKHQLINGPSQVHIPDDPSIKYALTALVAETIDADNVEPLMEFIERLPLEFQVITMQGIFQKAAELLSHDLIMAWKMRHASELI